MSVRFCRSYNFPVDTWSTVHVFYFPELCRQCGTVFVFFMAEWRLVVFKPFFEYTFAQSNVLFLLVVGQVWVDCGFVYLKGRNFRGNLISRMTDKIFFAEFNFADRKILLFFGGFYWMIEWWYLYLDDSYQRYNKGLQVEKTNKLQQNNVNVSIYYF